VIARLAWRSLTEPHPRLSWRFAVNAGWKGMRAIRRFRRAPRGDGLLPPFLFISVTNACNLCCKGCWVTQTSPAHVMAPEMLDRIITAAQRRGSSFFGILGGEPLLHPGLLEVLERHPEAYFQLFTNGLLLTEEVAARLRRMGNVTPLISIEGVGAAGDARRGGRAVTERSLAALDRCRRQRLIFGVATSLCKTNLDDLATDAFLAEVARRGALYAWYYIYRPVGPDPAPELALDAAEILRVRRFLVDVRARAPLVVVDAYWDQDGRALCPAASGLSHHISPDGDLEPCPVVQFAADRLADGADVEEKLAGSAFLRDTRAMFAQSGRGCIVMRDPAQLAGFLRAQGARDTTQRGTGLAELDAMAPRPDHDMDGTAIPERHWLYRMAKRNVFFGFGAYG
jgi:MoaA/NifB/PqqE/SkfB family radical SAM enzyme